MATPQELVTASACYGQCIPDPLAVLIYEFDRIRINGGGSPMTVQELITASACYSNCISDKLAALLVLANAIEENGGGGGGGGFNNKSGAGSPVGVVTPDYVGQDYLNTTPPYEKWTSIGLTNADWIQMI